jgi:ribonuclease HII
MIGVDEVGRGCLAGPLLVVAAKANADLPLGLRDSKLLSSKQREEILDLLSICCGFGEGWVKPTEIDKIGLAGALRLGVKRALRGLGAAPTDKIIIDGKENYVPKSFINSRGVIGADSSVPIVSAASIYAKVKRDNFMKELAKRFPAYGFDKHVGYGTSEHMTALNDSGFIRFVHRVSFQPVARMQDIR